MPQPLPNNLSANKHQIQPIGYLSLAILLTSITAALTGCNKPDNTDIAGTTDKPPIRSHDKLPVPRQRPESLSRLAAHSFTPTVAGRSVDAMVGQINGQPVYTSNIINEIGHQQLIDRAVGNSRHDFEVLVQEQVVAILREKVQGALLLAEAESALTPQQKSGLLHALKIERENLISQFGGTLAGAEEGVMQRSGRTLAQEIEAKRQEILSRNYLREKIWPSIHVSHRDVKHYYSAHYNHYNPPPSVTIRIILVTNEQNADLVDAALNSGTSFIEVAEKHSAFNAQASGLLPPFTTRLEDFHHLKWKSLNPKVHHLQVGQYSSRTPLNDNKYSHGWIYLDKLEQSKQTSLPDVYLDIEQMLTAQQFDKLSRKHFARLMERGNFTPLDKMLIAIIDVIINRYAPAPPE